MWLFCEPLDFSCGFVVSSFYILSLPPLCIALKRSNPCAIHMCHTQCGGSTQKGRRYLILAGFLTGCAVFICSHPKLTSNFFPEIMNRIHFSRPSPRCFASRLCPPFVSFINCCYLAIRETTLFFCGHIRLEITKKTTDVFGSNEDKLRGRTKRDFEEERCWELTQVAEGEEDDRKPWVRRRRRTGKRGMVGEGLLFTALLCHHQWCHCGRSGLGWDGEEAALTSSSPQRSARVCYLVRRQNDALERLSEGRLLSAGLTPRINNVRSKRGSQKCVQWRGTERCRAVERWRCAEGRASRPLWWRNSAAKEGSRFTLSAWMLVRAVDSVFKDSLPRRCLTCPLLWLLPSCRWTLTECRVGLWRTFASSGSSFGAVKSAWGWAKEVIADVNAVTSLWSGQFH